MDTDALISRLADDAAAAPLRRGRSPGALLATALAFGAAAAAALTGLALGWRADLAQVVFMPEVALKFALAAAAAATGWAFAGRLCTPAGPRLSPVWAAPAALAGLAAVAVAASGRGAGGPFTGDPWFCVASIFLISAPILAAGLWALRVGAPTRPALAGGAAGLAAGAAGAFGYAFYCPVDSVGFVCVWYLSAMALTAIAGALAGRRALAW
ncbi:MAG: NrsF family protein [Rubrimonas sp.]|uniref:NrsF family protein n=1 Tax=Rubrimonas sp. TaxID=2036015 RepID=UPI002FDD624B